MRLHPGHTAHGTDGGPRLRRGRARRGDAGIVDQDVDPAALRSEGPDGLFDGRRVGDVARDRDEPRVLDGELLKLGGYGINRIAYPICHWAEEQLALWVELLGIANIV